MMTPRSFQVCREWAEREFVVEGVQFHLLPVGHFESNDGYLTYFKIQIVGEEVSSSNIFEARYDKQLGKTFYSVFENMGLDP